MLLLPFQFTLYSLLSSLTGMYYVCAVSRSWHTYWLHVVISSVTYDTAEICNSKKEKIQKTGGINAP